ncbi:MAG: hypothetical protein KDI01_04100, partial [Halioglobus sp.]|nr:hypothetical protein [Halioglobus sp.]
DKVEVQPLCRRQFEHHQQVNCQHHREGRHPEREAATRVARKTNQEEYSYFYSDNRQIGGRAAQPGG